MRVGHRVGLVGLAVAMLVSGCYGPFNLTRRLHNWNGQLGGKWEREFMFLILAYVPVYGLAILGDALVFNSMEFWTGDNPVDPPGMKQGALPQTKRIVRGDSEALLTYIPTQDGAELLVQQFHRGQPAGTLRIAQRDGMTVGSDADGRVLLMARSTADGGIVVSDAHGQPLAAYGSEEAQRLLKR